MWDHVALDFVRDGTKGLTAWAIWLGPLTYQKRHRMLAQQENKKAVF